jgi:hypothetical protein
MRSRTLVLLLLSASLLFGQTGSSTVTTTINIRANDLVWDPNSQKIYLSLPSTDGANGNSVQVLDPVTGQLGAAAFAGSEPNLRSASASGKYLYVSLDGASAVQRMTLPNLGTDIKIALGSSSYDGAYSAGNLQASPVADGTLAIVRENSGVSPAEEGGVTIYDDATARPNALCGFIQAGCISNGALYDTIQWNADGTMMFAANNEDTGFDFYTIPVNPRFSSGPITPWQRTPTIVPLSRAASSPSPPRRPSPAKPSLYGEPALAQLLPPLRQEFPRLPTRCTGPLQSP